MAEHDIIVIGASAGGIEALQTLVRGLPSDLPAAVFIVWHLPAHSLGVLPEVLARAGPLPAAHARDGDPIVPGRIAVAPPDHHLLLEGRHVRLTRGPKENHFRPAIDPLFRSAAAAYGARVIGVVLTGMLDDGTAGLWTIKDCGGLAVVQEPDEALYPSMPLNALTHVAVDHRRPVAELGPLLALLARQPAATAEDAPVSDDVHIETRIALEDDALALGVTTLGRPSLYTCPECHGVLLQLHGDGPLRFRCHTGHAYSAASLHAHTADTIEAQLWGVVRAMDEQVVLLQAMVDRLPADGALGASAQLRAQASAVKQQRQQIRQLALAQAPPAAAPDGTDGH